ncbi:MAG TPA: hypothetical protein VLE27_13245 [Thermoanaerobaculia bacterium]|nr:hypothetical protein [Thermoanaerobaculia bacterium]
MFKISLTKIAVCLAVAGALAGWQPAAAQSGCYGNECGETAFCDQMCFDNGYERTCGDVGRCAQPCWQVCGTSTHCNQYCDDNGSIKRCQEYGSCDPGTCEPIWVEVSRTPAFNFYQKSYWAYSELWADQLIYEQDIACGLGQRERCDPYLRSKCYGTSDCCAAWGMDCLPGYSLCPNYQ